MAEKKGFFRGLMDKLAGSEQPEETAHPSGEQSGVSAEFLNACSKALSAIPMPPARSESHAAWLSQMGSSVLAIAPRRKREGGK